MTSESLQNLWKERIHQWRSSGLSQAAWCEQQNIPPNQLCYWKKKLLPSLLSSKLIPVSVSEPSVNSSCEATISLPSGLQLKIQTADIAGLVQELSRL